MTHPFTRSFAICLALALVAVQAAPAAGQGVERGAFGAPDRSAEHGRISGTVVAAETGRVVSAATVALELHADGDALAAGVAAETRTTWTDDEGRYHFADVPPGHHRLTVTRLGYRSSALLVELPRAWRIERSLGLEVEPVALRPIDITVAPEAERWAARTGGVETTSPSSTAFGADLSRPTLDARILTPADIGRLAALGEPDVLRALQRLPGASGRGDHSAGLWTRGAPWGMTRVLFDGLPLYHPLHLGGTTSGLAADGLAAVVFLPGARPAALAEGAAGTVNLVSRRAESGGARGSASLSALALRIHAEDRWLDDRVGLSVTARRSWWDKVKPPSAFTGRTGSADDVDYWFGDAVGRMDVRLGEWGLLEAGGIWEEDRLAGDIGTLVGSSHGRWGNHLGWAALAAGAGPIRGRLTVGRTVHHSRTRPFPWASFYDERGIPTLDAMDLDLARTVTRLEVGGPATAPGGALVEWSAGIDRSRETLRQAGADARDRRAPGVDTTAVLGWYRLWGQGTVRIGPARIAGGLVWDAATEGDPPGLGLLPNGSVRVDVTERLTLEASRGASRQLAYPFAPAGRTFGPALGVDHVWMLAGEDRPPLTSDVRTLAAEVGLDGGFGIALTAFDRRVDGLALDGVAAVTDGRLAPVVELDGEARADVSEGTEDARGLEVSVWRREGRVRGDAAYTWSRSEMTSPAGVSWPSPADRRHALDATLSVLLTEGVRLGAGFRAESGWPYVLGPWACPPNEAGSEMCEIEVGDPRRPTESSVRHAPAYRSLDIGVDWLRPGETVSWAVSLGVRNALGRENWSAYRPDGCPGAEVISVGCESPQGVGEAALGLTRPTPSISVRVLF